MSDPPMFLVRWYCHCGKQGVAALHTRAEVNDLYAVIAFRHHRRPLRRHAIHTDLF